MKITDGDIYRFTCGDCHVLAYAIHKLTNWTMCAFSEGDGPNFHSFVRHPSGYYLDIRGLEEPDDFIKRWAESCQWYRSYPDERLRVIEADWKTLRGSRWPAHSISSWSPKRAKQLAPILVANV